MSEYYILTDSKQCVPCDGNTMWASAWSKSSKVKCDVIKPSRLFFWRKSSFVSTVFLGINHNWGRDRDSHPILFETIVFGGKHNDLCQRYETYNEAVNGHERVLKFVKGLITRL